MSFPIKTKLVKVLAILFLIYLPMTTLAQPPGEDCDYWDPMNECPIDGGVAALLVVGAAYGAKKVRASRMKKTEEK